MGSSSLRRIALVLLVLAAGCNRNRGGETETQDVAGGGGGEAAVEAGPPPAGWPRVLVTGPGTGPGLYLGPDNNAPAFGYVSPGVRVRIESGVRNGRVEVLVAGGLPTKAWMPMDRVSAYAQRRGRVNGTSAYVGANDLVGLAGPAEGGQIRVAVRPWLGGSTFLDPQVGTLPADAIADRPVDAASAEAPTPGDCFRLPPGREVAVFDQPGGRQVAVLPPDPPQTVVVLRARDPWYGIRAGYGPYVVGYVQGPLTACEGARPEPPPMVPPAGEMPAWIANEDGALYRVAQGTRIRFNGRTIARLRAQGWAREIGRQQGDLVDVFVAVDNGVALRGLVPMSALTLVEGARAAPAEPVPDELQ
jgi:hypothetical protein